MRFREKLLIFVAAVIMSVLGFYLISSPFVSLYTLAKETGNENIENSLSECDGDTKQMSLSSTGHEIFEFESNFRSKGVNNGC